MVPDYIIVDFDSTFITYESLDELAKYKLSNHPDSEVLLSRIKSLTNAGIMRKELAEQWNKTIFEINVL